MDKTMMTYTEFISLVQEGDILLTHNYFNILQPVTYLSYGIRKVTKSHWNHAECVIKLNGEWYIVGATFPRCRTIKLSEWYNEVERELKIIRKDDTLSFTDYIKYRAVLMGAVGYNFDGGREKKARYYDIASLFYQLKLYMGKRKKWIGRTGEVAAKSYYCSELAAHSHKRDNWFLYSPDALSTDPYFTDISGTIKTVIDR
jgi:hypothetical protein